VEAAVAGWALSAEQRAMVAALAAADGLAVVVGPAGAGKTAALAAAAGLHEKSQPQAVQHHPPPIDARMITRLKVAAARLCDACRQLTWRFPAVAPQQIR
jgi:type II secretory pathway predicted ATPase ExeA